MASIAWIYAAAKDEDLQLMATAKLNDESFTDGMLSDDARKRLLTAVVSGASYSIDEIEIDVVEDGLPLIKERWTRKPLQTPAAQALELWPGFSMYRDDRDRLRSGLSIPGSSDMRIRSR